MSVPDAGLANGERRLAYLCHAMGLLGVLGFGWLVAAAFSFAVARHAAAGRRAGLVLAATQAAVYQTFAFVVLMALGFVALLGYLFFAGDVPGLPSLPLMDLPSPLDLIVPLLWLVSIVAVPAWYVYGAVLALRASRQAQAGRPVQYPVVMPMVASLARRVWPWMWRIPEPDTPI